MAALLWAALGVSAAACVAPPPAGSSTVSASWPTPQPAPFVAVPEMTFTGPDQPVPDGPVDALAGLYGQYGSSLLTSCRIEKNRMLCSRLQAVLDADRPQVVEVAGQVANGTLNAESWNPVAWDQASQAAMAQAHLDQAAPALAGFDWSRISRPDFAESSRQVHLAEAELKALPIELAGYDSTGKRIIWRAQGPDMPPQKPLVTRYPVLYIVTDPAGSLPSEMFVTIEGHVEE